MGKSKERSSGSSTTVVNQTSTPQPTEEEKQLNALELQRQKELYPYTIGTQRTGLQLVQQLLSGNENLPGFFGGLQRGIDPAVTQSIVDQSLRDIQPQFAQTGLIDSGVRASISARTAGDIRRQAEEFNIGNRFNLLNLALGGQAQVQQPVLGFEGLLSQRLAGLRSINESGTTTRSMTSQTSSPNPFLSGFLGGAGEKFGGAAASMGIEALKAL